MKKAFYIIIPVFLAFIAFNMFNNKKSNANNASSCNLSAKEYADADKEDAIIIDVRTQREFVSGHLENAILIDIYSRDFKKKIGELDTSKKYYVYCKTGIRSRNAVNYMLNNGFSKVCNLEGGLNYLSRAGVKLVR